MTVTPGSLKRAVICAACVVLAVASAAQAQWMAENAPVPVNVKPGTTEFARIVQGRTVWITMTDGTRSKGQVTSVGATSLAWTGHPGTVTFDRIVKVQKDSHRLRNTLAIGISASAGLQFLVTVASVYPDESCLAPTFMCAGGILAIGTAASVGLGLKLKTDGDKANVIYDAKRSGTTMTFTPIISKGKKGIAMSISWR